MLVVVFSSSAVARIVDFEIVALWFRLQRLLNILIHPKRDLVSACGVVVILLGVLISDNAEFRLRARLEKNFQGIFKFTNFPRGVWWFSSLFLYVGILAFFEGGCWRSYSFFWGF
jgi:hypothetical protein